MEFVRLQRTIADVDPGIVTTVLGFPIANSFLMLMLVLLLIVGFIFIVKRFKLLPSGFQNTIEYLYEGMYALVDQITGSRESSRDIFSLIGALFIFVGLANMIGFVPGLTSITWSGTQMFRIPTSDFNTTFGLALAMMLFVQYVALRDWGFFGYVERFIKVREVIAGFREGIGAGFTALIDFFIGLLDIISEIAKVVSLSLRLFGNLYAGEVLAVILLGALAYVLPSTWMALNMLFALVQTLVFALLVTAYYQLVRKPKLQK